MPGELTCYFLAGKASPPPPRRKQMECSLGIIKESVLKGHSQGWGAQKSWGSAWGSITEEPLPPQTTGPGAVAGTWESSCDGAGGRQQPSETPQGRSQGINYPDFTLTPSDSRPCLPLAKPNRSQRGRKPFQVTRSTSWSTKHGGEGWREVWREAHGNIQTSCAISLPFLLPRPHQNWNDFPQGGTLLALFSVISQN